MGERSPAAKSSSAPDSPEELSRDGGSGLLVEEAPFGAGELGGEGDSGGRADSVESRGVSGRDSVPQGGLDSAMLSRVVLQLNSGPAAAESGSSEVSDRVQERRGWGTAKLKDEHRCRWAGARAHST